MISLQKQRLTDQELSEDYLSEPSEIQNGFCSFGDYELVGHGKVTSYRCGRFLGFRGCAHTELHNKTTLDGKNYAGKVFVRKVHSTYHKATCPVCYKHGWAVREAKMIAVRLVKCSKRFDQVEHTIVSPPQHDYGFSLDSLRHKAVHAVMKNRGIIWRRHHLSWVSIP